MPKKRTLTSGDKASLEKYLEESRRAALIVKSTFSGYFMQRDEIMKDVEELLRDHARIKERLSAATDSQ
jgi:hypothetical protein